MALLATRYLAITFEVFTNLFGRLERTLNEQVDAVD